MKYAKALSNFKKYDIFIPIPALDEIIKPIQKFINKKKENSIIIKCID